MAAKETLLEVSRKLNVLEQRLDVLAGRIETGPVPLSDAPPDGRALHDPARRPAPTTGSLFETFLERIVQGYHGCIDLDDEVFVALVMDTLDLVCLVGLDGTIRSANPAFLARLGWQDDDLTHQSFLDVVEDPYRSNFLERIHLKCRQTTELVPASPDDVLLLRLLPSDGAPFSIEAVIASVGQNDAALLVMRDLSTYHGLLEQLRQSRDNYDALSETITEAIVRINENLEIVFVNSAAKATFGFEPHELRGKSFSVLFPESVFRRCEGQFKRYFVVDDQDRRKLGMANTMEILGLHKNRGVSPMEMSFGNSKDYRGRSLTCIIRDITQRKNAERRLRHLAYHDQLTGLGNRDLFEADVRRLLDASDLFAAGYAALMFLDLDGFKQVNDTIGHDAGDQLLVQTAGRLRKMLRESDSVYRFGGDEFVILLTFIHDRRGASVVANNILGEIRRPYHLSMHGESVATVSVGVSIGIAIIPEDGDNITAVTKAADLAMYSAKDGGKNTFVFYDQSLDARMHDRWRIEQGIRVALERHEFGMRYQPLVSPTGAVLAMEALLRWNHPGRGEISPACFIPVAEETGIIMPLGSWAIETAFRDAQQWPDNGAGPPAVSVNLSARQFERSDLVESIGSVIGRTRIDPARIILEITETCMMSSPERSIQTLETLKSRFRGLSIAIDDFGTGYSSLSYLTRLPADILKIDISFVSNLGEAGNEKIMHAIINLGHSLGLRIVAEGVETEEQFRYFLDKGCYAFQGHYFAAPAGIGDVPTLINAAANKGSVAALGAVRVDGSVGGDEAATSRAIASAESATSPDDAAFAPPAPQ